MVTEGRRSRAGVCCWLVVVCRIYFQEEEVEEADMMDQLMEDVQEQEMFQEWEEDGKKKSGRQICDRVVESSYRMATCTGESVVCMSPVPAEEVPKRKSEKFLAECASAFLDEV